MMIPTEGWNEDVQQVWYYRENGDIQIVLIFLAEAQVYEWTGPNRSWTKLPHVQSLYEAQATALATWRLDN